ncbi:hypothetical protein MAM1_0242d08607 [Mucor ambiguus]|uniref:Uncharacterized protein n=1 Tax=Mucor ambiguus TaxID=91626 RepID=A0A0C9LWT5_9FUNG|nr:hypothetical protein MAM1_0242d08607 [Mucor ambiguus]
MNVDSRLPVVYPTFHDSQQQQQKPAPLTKKEMTIDDSIYHLLSMYLDTNTSVFIPPAATQNSRVVTMKHSPYFRTKRRMPSQQQHPNWLGEKKKSLMTTCTELERNTIKNSYTASIDHDLHVDIKTSNNKTKARPKSVSFSETVTVINLDKLIQPAPADDNEDDEDLFVDALENFTE